MEAASSPDDFVHPTCWILLTALLVLGYLFLSTRVLKLNNHLLPPGPKSTFLVGNLFDLPSVNASARYLEWGIKYSSSIVRASCFGKHFIVLNSLSDAEALLDGRANIYSDRPHLTVLDIIGWGSNTAFMPQGDIWRKHRRIAQQNLRLDAIVSYYPTQLRQTHTMLQRLLDSPDRFHTHNQALSIGIAMSMMYGYDLEEEDPYVQYTSKSSSMAFALMHPGFTMVNFFPFLQFIPTWVPFTKAQKMIQDTNTITNMLISLPMENVKNNISVGNPPPSLATSVLEQDHISKAEENAIAGLAFTIYTGASDTTISATDTFFYLMATHPEIQAKAQREIDAVIGTDRLPTFDDMHSLPYIEALYREVLRWMPPTPMGLAHRVTKDDYYKGYFIPEGSTVFANIWAMCHDASLYPEPMAFRPERFILPNGELTKDDRVLTFGFGRRVCVGKHVAHTTLWITFASVLAAFNITKAKDSKGQTIEPTGDYEDLNVVIHKNPFKCSVLPRSETARRLIHEAFEQDVLKESA